MDPPAHQEAWKRLRSGSDLDGLGLRRVDGRWDLRGLRTPSAPVIEVEKAQWRGIDFSTAKLEGLRCMDMRIEDCVFDRATFADWRLWQCVVSDCTFRRADLRGTGMAGGHLRRGRNAKHANVWRSVRFDGADLRDTAHHNELYEDCDFSSAKLARVDFAAARHVRSVFRGVLDEVVFERLPDPMVGDETPNAMEAVDFSAAVLKWVEFRGLPMLDAALPPGAEHVRYRPRQAVAEEVLRRLDAGTPASVELRTMAQLDCDRGPRGDAVGIHHITELGDTEQEQAHARALIIECAVALGGTAT
jgi:uncharacterized protein YjbI with pentapeptide repeats